VTGGEGLLSCCAGRKGGGRDGGAGVGVGGGRGEGGGAVMSWVSSCAQAAGCRAATNQPTFCS